MTFELGRRALLAAAAAVAFTGSALAESHQVLDKVHFLIPGGAGGGILPVPGRAERVQFLLSFPRGADGPSERGGPSDGGGGR